MKKALRLAYKFLGATSIGLGIYTAVWLAVKPLRAGSSTIGANWLLFPLFFGIGGLLWALD